MLPKFKRFHAKLPERHRTRVSRLIFVARHPLATALGAFIGLLVLALIGLLIFHLHGSNLSTDGTDIVIISHDHQVQTVPSHEPTVKALLAKLGLHLNEGDVVEPALTTPIQQDDFRINIYRAAPVKIIDGATSSTHFSAATTSRSIAVQSGLTLYPEDESTLAPVQNFFAEGAVGNVVTIDRSVPVTLDINGFPTTTRTRAKNVAAFLIEKRVALGTSGTVQPARPTPITAGQVIHVARDGTGIQSVNVDIPMPMQVILDDSLAYGTSAVRQTGSNGTRIDTYKIVVKNAQVVDKTLVQSITTVQPVTQIVVQGTNLSGIKGDMALAGIAPGDYEYADYIISHESGWCPTKAQGEHYCPAIPDNQFTPNGYGLCQATPGSKMSSAGEDWATNPVTQLKWCSGYAERRYGSWAAAYSHWLANRNW